MTFDNRACARLWSALSEKTEKIKIRSKYFFKFKASKNLKSWISNIFLKLIYIYKHPYSLVQFWLLPLANICQKMIFVCNLFETWMTEVKIFCWTLILDRFRSIANSVIFQLNQNQDQNSETKNLDLHFEVKIFRESWDQSTKKLRRSQNSVYKLVWCAVAHVFIISAKN